MSLSEVTTSSEQVQSTAMTTKATAHPTPAIIMNRILLNLALLAWAGSSVLGADYSLENSTVMNWMPSSSVRAFHVPPT